MKKIIMVALLLAAAGASLLYPIPALAGDSLTLALRGEPDEGFDPLLGWGRYGNPMFQSTLLARDNNLNIVKDLAVDYSLSNDGLTWNVTIRDDAVFFDGKPVRAEDVAFTFNHGAKAGGKVDLSSLDQAVVVGPQKVELRLSKPDSTFINRLITLGIVPEHAYGPGYGRKPLGSGPYVLVSWTQGEKMIAQANPRYYGAKPAFKQLIFLYGAEDAMFAAAKAGQVQMVAVPSQLGKQKIKGMHVLPVKSVDNRGLMFPMVPNKGETTAEGAPIGNNLTIDPAIRRAVNLAVDRQALVDGVLEGFGRPAYFVCDSLPWDNPENKIKDADVDGAVRVLEDAGWKDSDGDGVREKNGRPLVMSIVYPAGDSIRQGLALACVDMLGEIGIKVELLGKSWDEIKRLMHSEVILFGWGSHDPMEMYNLYHSAEAGRGWNNPGYYSNPEVDQYLEKAITVGSYDKSLEWWKKSQWDGRTGAGPKGDAPWAWLVNLDHVYFVSDCLDIGQSRVEPHGHGWPVTANINEWTWKCAE